MTNRQRVLDAVSRRTSRRLADELEYQTEANGDDSPTYDKADALWDALRFSVVAGDRPLERLVVDVLIDAGFYRPRKGEVEICGRDRAPVRKGVRYDEADDWGKWIVR